MKIRSQYSYEFLATPASDLWCNICDVLVQGKKFLVESHRKSKNYRAELHRKSGFQGKKIFLQPDQLNFKKKVISSFLAVGIPLHKLNHTALESLFATMGKVLPSKIAAVASVAQLASQKENLIREVLDDKKLFDLDKAEVTTQNY